MCGRYTLTKEEKKLLKRLGIVDFEGRQPFVPRYNIAPTQDALVAFYDNDAFHLEPFRWGLIPSWAKDAKIGNSLINARCETIAEKPAFRSAFKRRSKQFLIPSAWNHCRRARGTFNAGPYLSLAL